MPTETKNLANQVMSRNDVLAKIGRASNFIRADVKHLFDNRYRVNIWAMKDGQTCIVHSEYLIVVDDKGGR